MLISRSKLGRLKLGLMLAAVGLLSLASQALAQTGSGDRQVNDNLRALQNQMSSFRYDLEDALNARPVTYRGDDINQSLEELEDAISAFTKDFRAKRESSEGVNKIMQEAQGVNDFMRSANLRGTVATDWRSVRTTLDQLALNYKVFWSWNDGPVSNANSNGGANDGYNAPSTSQPVYQPNTRTSAGLSGTYRLDASASDDAKDVAARAVLIINSRDRDRMKADLEEKLAAPDSLTLDIRGQQVTIISSKGGQYSFVADGADKYETGSNGKNIRVRALLRSDRLTITRTGDGDDDYTAIFESIDNGSHLRVTRRVNYPSLSQTVIAESMYNKTSDMAQNGPVNGPADEPGSWSDSNPGSNPNSNGGNNGGNNNGNNGGNNYPSQYPSTTNGRQGDFIVPNGVTLTARLDTEVTTKLSQNNDRFKMTVTAPDEFRGATIEGYLSNVKRSGKINGRAEFTFNFERIKLRSGESYQFAGYLQSITNTLGETVKIDNEGVAKGDNQTKETAKRGGVGAAIGAVIGGVLGGIKGAVIGATIGGAGGAGSVYVQGRDDLELKPGSTVVLQSSGPRER